MLTIIPEEDLCAGVVLTAVSNSFDVAFNVSDHETYIL